MLLISDSSSDVERALIVRTERHGGHTGGPKQRNGSHLGWWTEISPWNLKYRLHDCQLKSVRVFLSENEEKS